MCVIKTRNLLESILKLFFFNFINVYTIHFVFVRRVNTMTIVLIGFHLKFYPSKIYI